MRDTGRTTVGGAPGGCEPPAGGVETPRLHGPPGTHRVSDFGQTGGPSLPSVVRDLSQTHRIPPSASEHPGLSPRACAEVCSGGLVSGHQPAPGARRTPGGSLERLCASRAGHSEEAARRGPEPVLWIKRHQQARRYPPEPTHRGISSLSVSEQLVPIRPAHRPPLDHQTGHQQDPHDNARPEHQATAGGRTSIHSTGSP